MKVGFVSLGCSKNLVDTEMAIGIFKRENFEIVNDPKKAEMIIINTCGFITQAKEEAVNTILEMAEYKNKKCKFLVVMGCLVQRYKKDLEKLFPEVDLFLSIDEYGEFWNKISDLIHIKSDSKNTLDYMNRTISTGSKTAYLKIAEGCSNNCTYCAIPYIRGPYESRKFEDIIEEAKSLAKNGYKEIIVIAQDTTKYGEDLYGKRRLPELLEELCKIREIKWIRFLYAYPESIDSKLIKVVKENDKICKYFDIPVQHISNKVLKMMARKTTGEDVRKIIFKIRKEIPGVILRTSLIVGFPGETEEDFFDLYEFVNEAKFEKLGVFKYSKEEGTPAARIKKGTVHPKTKEARRNKIMALEKQIAKIKLEEKIGNKYEVVVDGYTIDNEYIIARSYMDIPDEDGVIYIKNDKNTKIGDFIKCEITGVIEYDLVGKKIK